MRSLQTHPEEVRLGEDEGRVALLIDGVVQSVALSTSPLDYGYWPLMLPDFAPRQALVLGLGGGTILHLLVERYGPLPILAIEDDRRVIDLAYRVFGVPRCAEVREGDAFMALNELTGPYDYIAVDLFRNNAVPARVFGRPFLRRLRELVSGGGLVAANFFRDRRTQARLVRLESVFNRVTMIPAEKNVVALCRAH